MFRSEKVVAAPDWLPSLRARQLESVDAVYRFSQGDAITRSSTTEVRRVSLVHGDRECSVYIKKYWVNSLTQLWSGMFRGALFGRSKARREYTNLRRLRQWGLDAPGAVAYGEERRARCLFRSFLISEGVAAPCPLNLFIRDVLPTLPERERSKARRELIMRLASYTRRLHARRFVHHDLFWRNIILSGRSLDCFFLIDAHKGKRWMPWAAQRSRAKDLATLDAPAPWFFRRPERLRFYLHYVDRARLTISDRRLVRRVLAVAEPMRERQLNRVRTAPGSVGQSPAGPIR
jgi:hypothetical protein